MKETEKRFQELDTRRRKLVLELDSVVDEMIKMMWKAQKVE